MDDSATNETISPDSLTRREHEVVRLASVGLTNQEIADRLDITEGTVKIHLHNIFKKLGVRNRTALAAQIKLGREEFLASPGVADASRLRQQPVQGQ